MYLLTVEGNNIRRYCGPYIATIEGNRIREYCGSYKYEIEGFLTNEQMMALIALLFA